MLYLSESERTGVSLAWNARSLVVSSHPCGASAEPTWSVPWRSPGGGAALDPACVLPWHDVLSRQGPGKLCFCLPFAYQRGKCAVGCWVSGYLRVHIFMISVFGGATWKRVHSHFSLSWRRGSSGAANTKSNWICLEEGGGPGEQPGRIK